jgi:hypothetical protein
MSLSLRGDMSQVDTSRVDAEASASATPSGASPWKRRQVGAAGWQRWGGLRCCTTVLVGSRLSDPNATFAKVCFKGTAYQVFPSHPSASAILRRAQFPDR